MELSFSGYIKHIGDVQTIQKTNGGTFAKREIVIATNEQYPELMLCELCDEQATDFIGQIGSPITVNYHFAARQNGDRWYQTIRAWRYMLGATPSYQPSFH